MDEIATILTRLNEIDRRRQEMYSTYSGCDWCCGGGDTEMNDLYDRLLALYGH